MSTIPVTSGSCWCNIASMPCRSVTSAIPHPWHPPPIRTMTTRSCTSMSSTTPPCRATIGLTWVSNSWATRSYSASSSAGAPAAGSRGATAGARAESAPRMAAPTDRPRAVHGVGLRFTAVTRFPDTMISAMPGMANSASARGDPLASSGDAKRRTPPACTGTLTRNLQRSLSIGSAVMRTSVGFTSQVCPGCARRSTARHHRGRGRAQLLGGAHHVPERCQGLGPAPRLEAAVGVDPDLALVEHFAHAIQRGHDFLGARHAGRVDVVDARSDLVGIAVLPERLQQLRPRPRALDRDGVGVHALDNADDVVEFAVAHVRVDLRLVLH